ncbi:MAG: Fic family protein [Bacteroidetes bacterium]|nr:MAG: Fic family protein [Bacteroidota bacterium]TAG87407.1 MAG: Fic family protein [Bacteroidota bacterium]
MDITKFKSGNFLKQTAYKSFSPTKIHQTWEITDAQLNQLLSEANRYLGELNGLSQVIPDIDFFIMMHVIKEATTSSKIEGTQTSIEEALLKKEELNPERRNDWQEVHNYIEAMNQAIEQLEKLPLSNRLLRNTHETLLQGVRGSQKMPGEFRTSQNWIGGATLADATFIPPHYQEVPDLMSDLELFLNDGELFTPHLIKIGIAHYQFETIHPFLDGNGRIGRLLITLYLVDQKILLKPTLYLSDFFEQNRQLYYDNLSIVRTQNNLTQWLKFFLVGVIQTSQKAIQTFKEIVQLREKIEKKDILTLGRKIPNAQKLVLQLYKQPFITIAEIAENLECSIQTANTLTKNFVKLGILKENKGYKRNQLFEFEQYVRIFTKN